ncbi:MAG: prepilin-type N-terminal cleavage/methylation domain-containing protein [Verrucomicrobiota bacterium]
MKTFQKRHRTGFTLIELLVSMAILTLLMVAMASIVESVADRWKAAIARVNNFTKARVSLQIIGRDLTRGILREQLTLSAVKVLCCRSGRWRWPHKPRAL